MAKTYIIKEVYLTLQGEGVRAGTATVLVRFSQCNITCNAEEHGFDCDTHHTGGQPYTPEQLMRSIKAVAGKCRWILWTGGEPALQLDEPLAKLARTQGFKQAIETNGTRPIPRSLDWVCVSPKTPAYTLKVSGRIDEVKYVVGPGRELPAIRAPNLKADHYLVSPAYRNDGTVDCEALAYCVALCMRDPAWRLSIQQHKHWGIR